MFKGLIVIFVLILTVSTVLAADVDLKWDASPGATGYKIQKSLDLGVTWGAAIDLGNVTVYRFLNVEENVLILFRASAYNANSESIRTWSGAWFDQRKKPVSSPSGQGIQ